MAGLLDQEAVMRPFEPTFWDRIAAKMMGDGRASPERRRFVEGLMGSTGLGSTGMSVSDFTPAGLLHAGADYVKARDEGDGMGAALAAASMVPGAKGALAEAKPAAQAAVRGIRAYHGSPYDFDRFDLSKIGTGEGAQAYGHGLYFAENERVAKGYRDDLTRRIEVDGKPLVDRNRRVGTTGNADVDDMISAFNGDIDAALADIRKHVATLTPAQAARGGYAEEIAALEALRGKVNVGTGGKMYEVRINADPEGFLDWDKSLLEQPAAVREALKRVPGADVPLDRMTLQTAKPYFDRLAQIIEDTPLAVATPEAWLGFGNSSWDIAAARKMLPEPKQAELDALLKDFEKARSGTGGDLVHALARTHDDEGGLTRSSRSDFVSEQLREAGIPGIKYLDAGSRKAGDGSRNYVVFDDSLIEILRKYGFFGPVVGTGAAMTMPGLLDGGTE